MNLDLQYSYVVMKYAVLQIRAGFCRAWQLQQVTKQLFSSSAATTIKKCPLQL
jgi:hypothetical protein